jgi:hypothetical protein
MPGGIVGKALETFTLDTATIRTTNPIKSNFPRAIFPPKI